MHPINPMPGTRQTSGPSQDPVQVGAADRALPLGHLGAFGVHYHVSLGLALFLALHAVELAFVGFFISHSFLLRSGAGLKATHADSSRHTYRVQPWRRGRNTWTPPANDQRSVAGGHLKIREPPEPNLMPSPARIRLPEALQAKLCPRAITVKLNERELCPKPDRPKRPYRVPR